MFNSKLIVALALVAVVGWAGSAWADSITFRDGLNGYSGTADTRLVSQNPTTNFGGVTAMSVNDFFGVATTVIRGYPALVRFDDIFSSTLAGGASAIQINSATMKIPVYSYSAISTTAHMFARSMLTSWVEGTGLGSVIDDGSVTYAYRGYDTTGQTYWGNSSQMENGGIEDVDWETTNEATSDYSGVTQSSWPTDNPAQHFTLDFDITEIAKDWQDGSLTNNGVALGATGTAPSESDVMSIRFSEYATATIRPELVIDYTVVPEPVTIAILALGSAAVLLRRRR